MIPSILIAASLLTHNPAPAAHLTPTSLVRRALDDATIVAIFDAANTYDIEASQLAAKKAANTGVRDYANMLIKAHEAARQQGRDLAKKLGVTPTAPAVNPLAADHAAAMKQLATLSGKAFDRAFVENEIAYHKAVIGAVNSTLMPAIQNAELKAFVVKVAPVFVQHQQAGEVLLGKLN